MCNHHLLHALEPLIQSDRAVSSMHGTKMDSLPTARPSVRLSSASWSIHLGSQAGTDLVANNLCPQPNQPQAINI